MHINSEASYAVLNGAYSQEVHTGLKKHTRNNT